MRSLLSILNIHSDGNQKWVLGSTFLSGFLFTYINPVITKAIVTELPTKWLAFESLVGSLSGVFLGMVWKGYVRRATIRHFAIFAVSESTIGFILSLFLCFVRYDVWMFAIASLVYSTFIAQIVIKCIMVFKSRLWIEKEREIYANNASIVEGIVCIIWFSCALLFLPSLKLSLFLWGGGLCLRRCRMGDLDRQSQRLTEYCAKKGMLVTHILKEIGSGLNDNRSGFVKLTDLIIKQKVNKLVIEHKDRLTRFQFKFIKKMFESYGCEVIVINGMDVSDTEELTADMISLLASFSGKFYGKRSAERRKKNNVNIT